MDFNGLKNVAQKLAKLYVGDENRKSRKVKSIYFGDDTGVARLLYTAHSHSYVDSGECKFDDSINETQHFYTLTCSCGESIKNFEDHDFIWNTVTEATCTEAGKREYKCSKCNKVSKTEDIPKLGHITDSANAKAPTCTEEGYTGDGICTICGNEVTNGEVIPATGHTEVIDKGYDATCTTTGLTDGSHCSVCGEVLVEQEEIPVLSHNYSTVVTEPTCTDRGYTTYTCNDCDDSYISNYTDALGHNEIIDVGHDATCYYTGLTDGSHCSRCDKILVEQEVIPMTDHTPRPQIGTGGMPTCTSPGLEDIVICNVCNAQLGTQEVIPATGHNYKVTVVPPTCTSRGYTKYDCINWCCNGEGEGGCEGSSYIDENSYVDALVHDFDCIGKYCNADLWLWRCSECGFEKDLTFGSEDIQIGMLVHDDPVPYEDIEATCTEKGRTGGSCCKHCGAVIEEPTEIEPLGHKFIDNVCIRCNETYCELNGHNFVQDQSGYYLNCTVCNATYCSVNGHSMNCVAEYCGDDYNKEWLYRCSACGYEEDQSVGVGFGVDELPIIHTDIVGHKKVEPTCDTDGYEYYETCRNCNEYVVEKVTIPALGHDFKQDATTGYYLNCTRCGAKYCDVNGHDMSCIDAYCDNTWLWRCSNCGFEEIKNTGMLAVEGDIVHKSPTAYTEREATCTVSGTTGGSFCAACGETIVPYTVIQPLGHDFKQDSFTGYYLNCTRCGESYCDANGGHTPNAPVTENRIEPTCTTPGSYDSVVYCGSCGTQISRTSKTLSATGHVYQTAFGVSEEICGRCGKSKCEIEGHQNVVTDKAVAATCTTTGLTAGTHCETCGDVLEAQEIVPATGIHSYKDVVTPPTCTYQGCTTHTCTVCGDKYTDSYTDATGHTEGSEIDGVDATCTEDGWIKYRCATCYEHYTEIIPATGHYWVDATCTEPKTCRVCGTTEGVALGHTEQSTYSAEPTCTIPGLTEGKYCSVCNETLVASEEIPALGHTPGAAATCTTAKVCLVCKEVLEEALGHSLDQWGNKCTRCGSTGPFIENL